MADYIYHLLCRIFKVTISRAAVGTRFCRAATNEAFVLKSLKYIIYIYSVQTYRVAKSQGHSAKGEQ